MTKRQTEIFDFVCQGMTTEEIAEKMGICTSTVEATRHTMLENSGCKNMSHLVYKEMNKKVTELNNRAALRISEIM